MQFAAPLREMQQQDFRSKDLVVLIRFGKRIAVRKQSGRLHTSVRAAFSFFTTN